jgi:predicted Rossmann fold flavoprotein
LQNYHTIIIGAGAAGLMCGSVINKNSKTLIIDSNTKIGAKILISGGGRCNFANLEVSHNNYISNNPHFCKSALAKYNTWGFISLMAKHNLTYTEKKLGQLFCDQKAKAVRDMLVAECKNAEFLLHTNVEKITFNDDYQITTNNGVFTTKNMVIATGGPSIPKMGASAFATKIAKQFGIKTIEFSPALVPLTFDKNTLENYFKDLSGTSLEVKITCENNKKNISFKENILITHRGLSGPAILQISSYWQTGKSIIINLLPNINAEHWLLNKQQQQGKVLLKNILSEEFPKKFAEMLALKINPSLKNKSLGEIRQTELKNFAKILNNWQLKPDNTEGFRVAEVSLGGVDTDELSSKTFEAKNQKGLYFIGEAVDVTGWLGGYNFNWAWASGFACGDYLSKIK